MSVAWGAGPAGPDRHALGMGGRIAERHHPVAVDAHDLTVSIGDHRAHRRRVLAAGQLGLGERDLEELPMVEHLAPPDGATAAAAAVAPSVYLMIPIFTRSRDR